MYNYHTIEVFFHNKFCLFPCWKNIRTKSIKTSQIKHQFNRTNRPQRAYNLSERHEENSTEKNRTEQNTLLGVLWLPCDYWWRSFNIDSSTGNQLVRNKIKYTETMFEVVKSYLSCYFEEKKNHGMDKGGTKKTRQRHARLETPKSPRWEPPPPPRREVLLQNIIIFYLINLQRRGTQVKEIETRNHPIRIDFISLIIK